MNRLTVFLSVAVIAMSVSVNAAFAGEKDIDPAQQMCVDVVSAIDQASIDTTAAQEAPKYWTNGIMTQIGFSQVSLTNWAEGGTPTISLNGVVDANANYAKDKMIWENRLKISYGFIQKFNPGVDPRMNFSKSDDRINLDSKWGWMLVDKLYFSALLNFRTQLTPTNSWAVNEDNSLTKTPQSSFLAPGYLSLGLGIDYKPWSFLSVNFAPVTGNMVIVTIPELRDTYGNDPEQAVRMQLGAQLKLDAKYAYKTFKIGSTLNLFADYLKIQNGVQVYWDVDASWAVAKFLSINVNTSLVYDKNIKFYEPEDVNQENPLSKVQFKEVLSVGLTFTFGQYVKPE